MDSRVRVKICGITNEEDARAAVDAGAAALGFNFYPRSVRCVTPRVAAAIVQQLPPTVCPVGVFVDMPRETVTAVAREVGLRALQFHGAEPPEYCRAWGSTVIKAIRVRDRYAAAEAGRYDVDFILADAYVKGRPGGTGLRIVPEFLTGFDRARLILAGGLTADNVAEAVRRIHPFAVDVASGVESAPGKKDWQLMRSFVVNVLAA